MAEARTERLARQAEMKAALDQQVAAKEARKQAVKEQAHSFFLAKQEQWAAEEAREKAMAAQLRTTQQWYRGELDRQVDSKHRQQTLRKTSDEAAVRKWLKAQASTHQPNGRKAQALAATLRPHTEQQALTTPLAPVVRVMAQGTLLSPRPDPHIVYTQRLSNYDD